MDLASRIAEGDDRAVSRAISLIERDDPSAAALMNELHPSSGGAHRIGITGPPGAGKSTLAARVVEYARGGKQSVGILAVDVSSPITGGAFLGDRLRMRSAALDPEVFIRSMGNRGRPGGLCPAVWDAVRVLEASGRDVVLIETAGTGQTEIDVVHYADTVILVVVPESGDEIQIQKAGVLEVADIVVLNKADRPGADRLGSELLELARADQDGDGWMRPVVRTVGTSGDGTRPLCEAIESHRQWLESSNRLERKRREQLGWELAARAKELMQGRLERIVESCEVEPLVERVCSGELGMREAVEAVTRAIAGG